MNPPPQIISSAIWWEKQPDHLGPASKPTHGITDWPLLGQSFRVGKTDLYIQQEAARLSTEQAHGVRPWEQHTNEILLVSKQTMRTRCTWSLTPFLLSCGGLLQFIKKIVWDLQNLQILPWGACFLASLQPLCEPKIGLLITRWVAPLLWFPLE